MSPSFSCCFVCVADTGRYLPFVGSHAFRLAAFLRSLRRLYHVSLQIFVFWFIVFLLLCFRCGLCCCVIVPDKLSISLADTCFFLFVFLCLKYVCDHRSSISLGKGIRTDTGCTDEAGQKGRFNVKTTTTDKSVNKIHVFFVGCPQVAVHVFFWNQLVCVFFT